MRALALALMLAAAGASGHEAETLSVEGLPGWAEDDHAAALDTFRRTCPDLDRADWKRLCDISGQGIDPRLFFETFFRAVVIGPDAAPLFTGYYEPEIAASLTRTARFDTPIYRVPPELPADEPWLTRAEIEETGVLENRGLEIAWLEDTVTAFYLQVQGSGRLRLPDGSVLRLGYGASNGHDYRSPGAELVRRGVYDSTQVSAEVIRNWARRNPEQGADLLRHNPSYVFFRVLVDHPGGRGPLGAMNRPLTPGRSLAVDPGFVPLGAPVWLATTGADPLRRLMVAQDTGNAVKGAQRGDVFFGTGDAARRAARKMRDRGRIYVLLPIARALALAPGG